MTQELDVKQLLTDFDGLLNGHFCLTSGLHSDTYFQCAKLYQYPPVVKTLAQELAKKLSNIDFDTVIAPAIGGIIFGYEVAAACDKGMIELTNGEWLNELSDKIEENMK